MGVSLQDDGRQFTGLAAVLFSTAEAAKEAAKQGATVDGNVLYLKWGGVLILRLVVVFF